MEIGVLFLIVPSIWIHHAGPLKQVPLASLVPDIFHLRRHTVGTNSPLTQTTQRELS